LHRRRPLHPCWQGILDNQDWTGTGSAELIHRTDPLDEIDQATGKSPATW
jgi:hypothetical protein